MIENEHITLEEVEQAYYECRRAKRTHDSALQYELNYEINNYRLWRDLNSQTYEIGRSICFVVTRPKLREVFAANFRDRIVHHIIIRRFMPLFEQYMIDDSYNCRRGKGTYYGVNRLSGFINSAPSDAWVLKCDISAFFMSIDKGVSFVGGVVKPGRRYIGHRTVANFYRCVDEWNNGRYDDWQMFVSRYNSYNGFLRQYDSYAIRRRVWNRLHRKDRIYMCGHYDYVKLIKSKKQ